MVLSVCCPVDNRCPALQEFKAGKNPIMLATDVAARGLGTARVALHPAAANNKESMFLMSSVCVNVFVRMSMSVCLCVHVVLGLNCTHAMSLCQACLI